MQHHVGFALFWFENKLVVALPLLGRFAELFLQPVKLIHLPRYHYPSFDRVSCSSINSVREILVTRYAVTRVNTEEDGSEILDKVSLITSRHHKPANSHP